MINRRFNFTGQAQDGRPAAEDGHGGYEMTSSQSGSMAASNGNNDSMSAFYAEVQPTSPVGHLLIGTLRERSHPYGMRSRDMTQISRRYLIFMRGR